MSQFSRIRVFEKMQSVPVIPLFYHSDLEVAKAIVDACYHGGVKAIEFTNRGDFAHETFAELRKYCTLNYPDLALGIGSLTDGPSASLYIQLGADFIVTPVLRKDIAIVCNRRKILHVPGCASLQEIAQAEELGCELVKLFPGHVFGPSFVRSVKGPQPWTNMMITGGVDLTEESVKTWLAAGATCVGIGSKLVSEEVLASGNYTQISDNLESILTAINK